MLNAMHVKVGWCVNQPTTNRGALNVAAAKAATVKEQGFLLNTTTVVVMLWEWFFSNMTISDHSI